MAQRKRRVQKEKETGKREPKTVQRKTKRTAASRAAKKGWETRRRRAEEQERERQRRARARRQRERGQEEKEARRLAKWRKSYREYLKFRVPKKEREKLAVPKKVLVVCKVLFDADETEPREEHFWSNIRYLIGDSVGNQLARLPAQEGVARILLRQVSQEEYAALQKGTIEPDELGEGVFGEGLVQTEYDTEFDVDAFWSIFFDHARELLPKTPDGKSGGSLLVVKLEVCYEVGQVSSDQE